MIFKKPEDERERVISLELKFHEKEVWLQAKSEDGITKTILSIDNEGVLNRWNLDSNSIGFPYEIKDDMWLIKLKR